MRLSFEIIATTAMCAAAFAGEPLVVDGVAAEVGGVRITVADVMEDVREIVAQGGREGDLQSVMSEAYGEALSNRVARQLILLKYNQAQQKLPQWAFNRRIEAIVEEHFGGDRSLLVSMLNERGMTFEKWRKKIEQDTIISAMRQQFVDAGINVSPKDIADAYREKYADATLPGHVRVAMILLRPEKGESVEAALAKAETLAERLKSGKADFAAEARRLSLDPHARDGGDWGYIEPAEALRKELCDALDSLEVGQVSRPIVIGGDYIYIVKKLAVSNDLKVPLDAVYDKIERELRNEIGSRRFDEWIDSLRRNSTIRIYKPTL